MSAPDTTYFYNNVPLDDPQGRWFIDAVTESAPTPGLVSSPIAAAGIDGELFVPGEPYMAGVMGMTLNITDEDPGRAPSYAALYRNWDTVKGLLLPRHTLHTLTRRQGGATRETDARIAASTTPRELDSRTLQVRFLIDLPLPLWQDMDGIPWAGSSVTSTAALTVGPLAGATARCGHGQLRAAGPFSRVRFEDVTTGQWVELTRNVASGSTFILNLADLTGSVGSTNVTGQIDVGPGGFALNPNSSGVTQLRVTRAGGAGLISGTNLKRSFL